MLMLMLMLIFDPSSRALSVVLLSYELLMRFHFRFGRSSWRRGESAKKLKGRLMRSGAGQMSSFFLIQGALSEKPYTKAGYIPSLPCTCFFDGWGCGFVTPLTCVLIFIFFSALRLFSSPPLPPPLLLPCPLSFRCLIRPWNVFLFASFFPLHSL